MDALVVLLAAVAVNVVSHVLGAGLTGAVGGWMERRKIRGAN